MNRIGSVLLEFGMSFPRGHAHMKKPFQWMADKGEQILFTLMVELQELHEYYKYLNTLK